MSGLRRHTLVWLSQAPEAETDDGRARAAAWQELRRPFVVTRRPDDGGDIGLGFCTTDPAHPEVRPRRVAARTDPDRIIDGLNRTISPCSENGIDSFLKIIDTLATNSEEPLRHNWSDIVHRHRSSKECLAATTALIKKKEKALGSWS